MPQDQFPPGYEIIIGETDYFVKKDGQYVLMRSGEKRKLFSLK